MMRFYGLELVIYFLITCGNGRNARAWVMNDGSEMIKSRFDAGKSFRKYGRSHAT